MFSRNCFRCAHHRHIVHQQYKPGVYWSYTIGSLLHKKTESLIIFSSIQLAALITITRVIFCKYEINKIQISLMHHVLNITMHRHTTTATNETLVDRLTYNKAVIANGVRLSKHMAVYCVVCLNVCSHIDPLLDLTSSNKKV